MDLRSYSMLRAPMKVSLMVLWQFIPCLLNQIQLSYGSREKGGRSLPLSQNQRKHLRLKKNVDGRCP
jgi:hypothetical protein